MTVPRRPNDETIRFLHLLWQQGEVRELRVPKHNAFGHTASGYFATPEELEAAAAAFDGKANVFLTLNPVFPALLARANNRVESRAVNTAADTEIEARRWLFVDIDPVRPAGISSTEEERQAAFAVQEVLVGTLRTEGWPEPTTAMSGNGYYALYGVELPNDQESTGLLKRVLETLASRFNSPAAHIDTTVYNSARIIGLIGTLKVKGDGTADRPHRRSCLISVPTEQVPVSASQLRALAPPPAQRPSASASPSNGTGRALAELLSEHDIVYREQPADANGVTWYHVRRCPFHEDGRDFECGVGQKLPNGPYAGHGFHPECSAKGWQEWKRALGLAPIRLLRSISTQRREPRLTDFPRTDSGNAELFTQLYGDQVRFDRRRKRWLIWDEHHWSDDLDGTIHRLAKEAVRQRYFAATALDDLTERGLQARFAVSSENRQRLDAMLALAQSELPISDAGDAWDKDPWLLGVNNGVLDLRIGEVMDGLPSQRITNFTPIGFDPAAECPRWLQFLDEVFGSDRELIEFIRKAVGHSLTGDISEQCVFICHGAGSNGKSVFLAILRALAGGYACNAPFSAFELSNRTSIPNDLAALAGKRLVTSSETNDGTRLNEARFKALTGGDPVTARFLNAEFFTYIPELKLWLAVNHRPRVDDLSYGFWRRVRLIPFTRTFMADQDKSLTVKLTRELPGILAWALHGCLAWQQEGLAPPTAVRSATENYRTDSDPLSQFLDDCCTVHADAQTGATEIYRAYLRWASEQGMKESEKLTSTKFGTQLASRFTKKRNGSGMVYVGITVGSERSSAAPSVIGVQGSVQGWESNAGFNQAAANEGSLTREGAELPYTLHRKTPTTVPNAVMKSGHSTPTADHFARPTRKKERLRDYHRA
ncbi:MAG: hypothetical protein GEU75_06965 [Dehalococcoidia bacterium]|nr:hypothetical protein [Dehalococcoidia bacterium]